MTNYESAGDYTWITGSDAPRGDLVFVASGGREILRMKPDGTIQFTGLAQADAAREFLDTLALLYPQYLRKPEAS